MHSPQAAGNLRFGPKKKTLFGALAKPSKAVGRPYAANGFKLTMDTVVMYRPPAFAPKDTSYTYYANGLLFLFPTEPKSSLVAVPRIIKAVRTDLTRFHIWNICRRAVTWHCIRFLRQLFLSCSRRYFSYIRKCFLFL